MTETGSRKSFEAFNARFLSPEEIAKTFVPPAQYWTLLEPNHSVIIGPRGSGKTTLLKMLQLKSLASWSHEFADKAAHDLSFHAIFLGTDVLWGTQLEARTAGISNEEHRSEIRRASFRIHLSLAFLNAVEECRDPVVLTHSSLNRFGVNFSRETEAILSEALAKIWGMTPEAKSLLGLRIGLRGQLNDLLALTSQIRSKPEIDLPLFVHVDPVHSIMSAIDITNSVLGLADKRWAILCDELEIAPDMIRRELFQVLRSSHHSALFKLSLFPYSSELTSIIGPSAPTANNDYAPLDLSYAKRESAYEFCEALLAGMIEQAGAKPDTSDFGFLGDGWFDGGRSHRRQKTSPYAPPQGEFYKRAQILMRGDPTFRAYLARNKIDIRHVHELADAPQAPFRKALPYILTRSEFLRDGGARRSRKAFSRLYTGKFSLFSLSEGNPRVFINLMRPLVAAYKDNSSATIGRDIQVASAETTIHRFRASLAALPSMGYGEIRTVLDLVEVVGRHLEIAALDEEFTPEPPSTILVDDQVPEPIIELLGRALNAGAFVRMPDAGQVGVEDVRGARLRLAYTLAPEFKLPLVAGRSLNLSTIVRSYMNARRRDPNHHFQARLPFGIE